jgi:hypothetical protein
MNWQNWHFNLKNSLIKVIFAQVLHLGNALLCLLRKRIIVSDYVLTIAPSMIRISTLFPALISCLIS